MVHPVACVFAVIGITVVSWWKRFGKGSFPDSLREVKASIEPWAQRAA